MNVTVKIDDRLVRVARHRAVDSGLSLSGWLAQLIKREIDSERGETSPKPLCLLEALGDESLAEIEFTLPSLSGEPQEIRFDEP